MIEPDKLLNWRFDDIEQSYSADFAILYGLAIGIGGNPLDEGQLRYVSELSAGGLHAFPTLAVVLGYPGPWLADPATGVDYSRTVHAQEAVTFHAQLPAAGTVIARHRVIGIEDKGAEKGALITYDKELFDKRNNTHLATVRHTTFARGDGGYSDRKPTNRATNKSAEPLDWAGARRIELATLAQQALLYRLCADRNPLHAEPPAAALAGFDRPILHGLCTFGMAAYAVAASFGAGDAARLRSVAARFASPVVPGDVLVFEMHEAEGGIRFQARAKGRERPVLSDGRATLV